MDMNRHLRRWLNGKALEEMGDSYEGRIATVTEESIRNRFTSQRQTEPVITFEDGWRLLPNISQRRALIEFFGSETNEWTGHRLVVYRHLNQRTDATTGLIKPSWEKRVKLPAALPLRRHA